jgi:CHASE1-domain containing sensor protein
MVDYLNVEGTIVRWIVPLEGNEKAQDLDLSFEVNRNNAIKYSMATGKESIGGPLDLVQGGKGLIVFAPINQGNSITGFNIGVIRTEPHFDKFFSNFNPQYGITISADDTILYNRNHKDKKYTTRYVKIENFTFVVDITYHPSTQEYISSFSIGVLLILMAGILVHSIFKIHPEKIDASQV